MLPKQRGQLQTRPDQTAALGKTAGGVISHHALKRPVPLGLSRLTFDECTTTNISSKVSTGRSRSITLRLESRVLYKRCPMGVAGGAGTPSLQHPNGVQPWGNYLFAQGKDTRNEGKPPARCALQPAYCHSHLQDFLPHLVSSLTTLVAYEQFCV